MDRIESINVFAKVVAKQSFTGAARELRLSQAASTCARSRIGSGHSC
jgi:DNA-binding transcriptional LysR family regulator